MFVGFAAAYSFAAFFSRLRGGVRRLARRHRAGVLGGGVLLVPVRRAGRHAGRPLRRAARGARRGRLPRGGARGSRAGRSRSACSTRPTASASASAWASSTCRRSARCSRGSGEPRVRLGPRGRRHRRRQHRRAAARGMVDRPVRLARRLSRRSRMFVLVLGGVAAARDQRNRSSQRRDSRGHDVSLPRCAPRRSGCLFASLVLSCVGLFVPMVHLGAYALDAGLQPRRRA